MAVAFVRATYTEENALSDYLMGIFGWGKCDVIWKRGRFQCRMPRQLTQVGFYPACMRPRLTCLPGKREVDDLYARVQGCHYSTA